MTRELKQCVCCGNDVRKSKFLFKKGEANYFRCKECDLVFQNPQPVFKMTEEVYKDEEYHERYIKSEYIYLPTSRIYLDEIGKEFSKLKLIHNESGLKLLDIGCGIGYFLSLAKANGYQVQGADISKWAGIYAKQKFNIEVITGNFLELDFGENTYDIITMWQTIEHLPEPGLFLKKIYKLLKNGGYICIATPDVNSWIARFYKKLWNCYIPDEHICLFNFNSMKKIFERNNIKVVVLKRIHEREFFYEQIEYVKLFFIRVVKNVVLKTKILKSLFPKDIMKRWETQKDLEIPLPSIAYSVFAIGQKVE